MPGIENFAPDRTETSSGLSVDPNFNAESFSSLRTLASISDSISGVNLRPFSNHRLQAAVVIVIPGGTGSPALVISARLAPLPPSRSRSVRSPSALPPPKKYTYFPARAAGFFAAVFFAGALAARATTFFAFVAFFFAMSVATP